MELIQTPLLNQLRKLSQDIEKEFDSHLHKFENSKHVHRFEGWQDYFWSSDKIRKCHLKTIEPSKNTTNLWLMHINIFPQINVDLPILGLDIVSSPTKISGSFIDFSPVLNHEHPYMKTFREMTEKLVWKKERELPDWAKEIFSPYIVAAGSVRNGTESDQLQEIALKLIRLYLKGLDNPLLIKEELNTTQIQNKYCKNQKTNKQLHNAILAMGINEEYKNQYIEDVLFEEI